MSIVDRKSLIHSSPCVAFRLLLPFLMSSHRFQDRGIRPFLHFLVFRPLFLYSFYATRLTYRLSR